MIIVLLITASITSFGWINEILYRRKLIKSIREDISREIGWIKFSSIERTAEIEAFEECLRIIDDYV